MRKAVLIVIPVVFAIFIWTQLGGSQAEYITSIEAFRKNKQDFFKSSATSPFLQKGIEYVPVQFFAPNETFKVNAKLERLTRRETLVVTNSDGSELKYLKFAWARFKLDGIKHSLLILKVLGFGNQYFTAFGDETNGITTYGGGRYLDLSIGKSDQVEIDFNKAYNPYCSYSADYLCPLPPRENFLKVSIKAGEKDYLN